MKVLGFDLDTLLVPEAVAAVFNNGVVRLAVTGLSRAGKTIFVTSLVNNLLASPRTPARLPRFLQRAGLADRLVDVRICPPGAELTPRFRYQENLDALAALPPQWPASTTDVSEIALDIVFRPSWKLYRPDATATLKLIITDYPGEWLLDMPLLDQTYAQWSSDTLALSHTGQRAGLARDWHAFLAAHTASELADHTVAKAGHDLYRAFLVQCRDALGLGFLNPGRFLSPGGWGDPPLLWFCPLPIPFPGTPLAPQSLGALMEARFEAYKRAVREQFFERHLRAFDRQIVLVDVLQALHHGRDAFEDTRHALAAIERGFRVGRTLLSRWRGGIDRVVFAATKADHVPGLQRDNLRQLLSELANAPLREVAGKGAGTLAVALSSMKCTEDDTMVIDGRAIPVVRGTPVGDTKFVRFFPGQVPIRPPEPDAAFWANAFFRIPRFQPPLFDRHGTSGIDHLGLDEVLDFLLADKMGA